MPSFDIVSEVDTHELTNAVDQANREIQNRFDFKGTKAEIRQENNNVTLIAENDFQLKQMLDIFSLKSSKRNIDIGCFDIKEPVTNLSEAKQEIAIRQGIDKDLAKKITKMVKNSKMKVQASIQGEQIRVTGKKRDDLQQIITLLKQEDLGLPLQFNNFRD